MRLSLFVDPEVAALLALRLHGLKGRLVVVGADIDEPLAVPRPGRIGRLGGSFLDPFDLLRLQVDDTEVKVVSVVPLERDMASVRRKRAVDGVEEAGGQQKKRAHLNSLMTLLTSSG